MRLVPGMVLALVLSATADAAPIAARRYTVEEGLGHNYVTDIYQDAHGYIWFGTREGLSRFGGERFLTYGVADGLPQSTVMAIAEDSRHRLWVATRASGLSRLIDDPVDQAGAGGRRRRFQNYSVSTSPGAQSVSALLPDPDGSLWCLVSGPVTVTVRDVVFENNTAGFGGALSDWNNAAGAGVTFDVEDSTFRGNHADNGGAINVAPSGAAIVRRSLFTGNANGAFVQPGDLVGTTLNPLDPGLLPLANNGGATFTHALAARSPALDAGSPAPPGSDDACLTSVQLRSERAGTGPGRVYTIGVTCSDATGNASTARRSLISPNQAHSFRAIIPCSRIWC